MKILEGSGCPALMKCRCRVHLAGPMCLFPWQKQAIPAEFHVCGTHGAIMHLSQVTEAEVGGEFL